MVARIRHPSQTGVLQIHFARAGQQPQVRTAVGGQEALLHAIAMLIEAGRLQDGDTLSIESGREDE